MTAQDVWDWAARLSAHVHRVDELKNLRARIRNAQTQCGSCQLWMTDACPRETLNNRTGKKHGPSMSAIKCDLFQINKSDASNIELAQKRITELTQEPTP